jgi:hypothetical protein
MVYPSAKRPKIVLQMGREDAFLPLKKLALMPPKGDEGAGPLGSLE